MNTTSTNTASSSPRGSVLKKALIGVGAVVGVLVAVVVVAFLTLDPLAMVQKKKDELLQQVSAKIGRQLTTGDVTARVGTSLGATVVDVKLAGPAGPGGVVGKDQVSVQQVDIQFSLLRALVSFGNDLYVERFVVDGLVLRAARDADGRWDFQDILDKLAEEPKTDEPVDDGNSILDDVRIASMLIRNARAELDDAVVGRPLAVDALNVEVSDVQVGTPLVVAVTANLVDAAKQSPIDVGITLATLPKGLKFDPVPDVAIRAALTDVDLAPWGNMLPVDSPGPVAGTLRTNVNVGLKQDLATIDVAGTVNARGLVLREALGATATKADRAAAPKGTAIDLDVDVDAHLDDTSIVVKKLKAAGSGATVDVTLTLEGEGIAGLKQASVAAKVDNLGTFLTALPPSLRGLPEEVTIDGPVAAALTKNGADLTGNLDLDGARVRYVTTSDAGVTSPAFDKAAGKALHVSVVGKDAGKSLDISELALVLDTIKIGGTVKVPLAKDEPLSADIHSGAVSLTSLQNLVPPFREAIGRGDKVAGILQLDVNASADGKRQLADAAIVLKDLDINLASVIVKGNGDVKVKAAPGGSDVSIVAGANFDGLQVKAIGDDGTATLDKPVGLPLRLDADVVKKTSSAVVNAVKLVIGRSTINGKGTVDDIGGKNERLAVDFGTVDVAFNDLRQTVPGASILPAGGRMKGAVALRGALSAAGLGVDVKNLDVAFGSSVVKGTVGVDNLSAPKVDLDLPTVNLAFNDLRGFAKALEDLPSDGRYDGSVKVKGDTAKLSTMSLEAKITKLIAAKSDLAGEISVKNLDKPQFAMTTKSDLLDVDAMIAAFGGDDAKEETPKKSENPHGLGKATRDLLAGVSGKATMTATRAVVKDMKMSNFKGVLVMNRGVATFETLEFGFYGGKVSASGTTLGLPSEKTTWDIKLEGDNVDFGAFLSDQTKIGKLFKGTVSPKVGIKGKGLAFNDFVVSADGPAAMSFKEFVIGGLDVLGPLNDAIKKATAGKAGSFNAQNAKGTQSRGLVLNDFTALTEFVGGKLKLQKPVEANTPLGRMKITGASGLDKSIDFDSILNLTPATISTMTGGKVKPKADIPLPFKIGGTWDAPRITGLDVGALVKAIFGEQVAAIVDKGKDAIEDALKGEKDKAKDKAKAETDKAKAKAKEEADKQKQKAKDKAKAEADKAKDKAKDALGGLLGGKK